MRPDHFSRRLVAPSGAVTLAQVQAVPVFLRRAVTLSSEPSWSPTGVTVPANSELRLIARTPHTRGALPDDERIFLVRVAASGAMGFAALRMDEVAGVLVAALGEPEASVLAALPTDATPLSAGSRTAPWKYAAGAAAALVAVVLIARKL